MEETLQPQPGTGVGVKTIRYLETWKLLKGVEFIQKGISYYSKNEDCEKRLQEKLRVCPFSGSKEDEIVYTEKLKEELGENIKEQIHPEQAKWFNPTFIIPKLHQKWRKILDLSSLNKDIQTIYFQVYVSNQVKDLISKGDWATSVDLKSAFHNLIVYPPRRPYLAFEAMQKVYQYNAMPFGTQHSPILFAQALAMVLTKIRRESDIRILNYLDNLLLLHQNKERLREQTKTIMRILETFGWTIAQEKCETEPKHQINFLCWAWDLGRMYIMMTDLRNRNKTENIEEQKMEREYDTTQEDPTRTVFMVGGDSEERRNDSLNEDSRSDNKSQQTNNKKKMDAIYLGLFRYGKNFKDLQINAILNKSSCSIAIQDIVKQRTGEALAAKVKKIVKLCQQLKIQIQTHRFLEVSNMKTNTLSRLSTQGYYSAKKEKFKDLCRAWQIIPKLDLFATEENKLVDRFVAIGEEDEEAEWLKTSSRQWKEEIFWIHPPIPKIGKALIAWKKLNPKSVMITYWWPCQMWFTYLLTDSSRYIILGENSRISNLRKEIMKMKEMLSPWKIAAFLKEQESNKEETNQQSIQTM
ncbi:MAG: putative Transposon Ty3-G Gag-Pol polyprotein [Streblomastix strix]|uniref:Putative Transposon Ty3-G Gag-Pol polyprotein n=1 Tax=Streblomastix strix TaxID=222440 RepID=A0A5J4WXE9_9EUKA|nr:MAG: putative Transposon Ty3-G Gag-Pol polyprotein [Streblomastix strix]